MRRCVPEWVPDAVFYQIFPDRFCNGDPRNDPIGVLPWDSRPSRISRFGGDLLGITNKLDYLQDLGVNTLYLTPIFEAPSNHKYDTIDYFRVDPTFGGNDALQELVAALHSRGMRIILDGVFNHCGEQHPFFQDVIASGSDSLYWNWFTVFGDRVARDPSPNYACWAGVSSMPEWNHSQPETREYLLSIVRHWIREYGIDGWRLDTVEYLPPDFVRDIFRAAKEERSNAYVLGEVIGIATSWFKHEALDGVMHYKLWEATTAFFAEERWDAKTFVHSLHAHWHSYPEDANFGSYTLLSSHDRPRFLTQCACDARRLRLALAFQFTFPGAPAVYYGDEIGLEGANDPDNRRCFPWDEDCWNRLLLNDVRRLIALRHREPALRRGSIRFLGSSGRFVCYERTLGADRLIVGINADRYADAEIALPDGAWHDLSSAKPLHGSPTVPPLSYRILKSVAADSPSRRS